MEACWFAGYPRLLSERVQTPEGLLGFFSIGCFHPCRYTSGWSTHHILRNTYVEGIENNPIFGLFLRRRPFIMPPIWTITLSTRSCGSIFIVCFIPVTSSRRSTSATWKPTSKSTLICSKRNIKVDICIYTNSVAHLHHLRPYFYFGMSDAWPLFHFDRFDKRKLITHQPSVDQLMECYLITTPDCLKPSFFRLMNDQTVLMWQHQAPPPAVLLIWMMANKLMAFPLLFE